MAEETEGRAAGTGFRRFVVIDMVRGAAIIGVVFYHFAWDLRYFQFISTAVDTDLPWLIFARVLLASFMLLTGVSLALAHEHGLRWRPFWQRTAVLVAASAAVTLATLLLFPEAFVYFGVLHAIALFSVLALPFIRAPLWSVALVAAVFIIVPVLFRHEAFNERALSWIGFWTVPPLTNDLVPVFPWYGFVLAGLLGMRIALASRLRARLAGIVANGPFTRGLVLAGRWSLIIYLVHQPLLLGVLTPLAALVQPAQSSRDADFIGACELNCSIGSGEAGFCQRYCACSLEQVAEGNLWEGLAAQTPTPEQSRAISSVTRLCSAMARDE